MTFEQTPKASPVEWIVSWRDTISVINDRNDVVNSISSNLRACLMEAVELPAHSSRNSSHSNNNAELLYPLLLIRAGFTPDSQHHPGDGVFMSPPPETSTPNLPLPNVQLESVMM
jgi:hypothetical protein